MVLTIASWNIEKNGQSSTDIKQEKISGFIDFCCHDLNITVVFLCEVHSSRINDYTEYAQKVYGKNYYVESLTGGHSNAYVFLVLKDAKIELSRDTLKGLNRSLLMLIAQDLFLVLAHFKSGQTGLTKDQLQQAAAALQDMGGNSGRWAITGDMNWDYKNANSLVLPVGTKWHTCWQDQTQAKGGILDWCLAGSKTTVTPIDVTLFPAYVSDMKGPDHKPIIFTIQ